jgi:hypothetical protein
VNGFFARPDPKNRHHRDGLPQDLNIRPNVERPTGTQIGAACVQNSQPAAKPGSTAHSNTAHRLRIDVFLNFDH